MQHPVFTPSMAAAIAGDGPAPLTPCEMVTDRMLRDYAALDPLRIAGGDDAELLAALSMTLAEICAELLARRAVMQREAAPLSGASQDDAPAGQRAIPKGGR